MSLTLPKMPRRGSSAISAADLLKLLHNDGKNGFIRQKYCTKLMKSIKWCHRFVILAHNAVYIYENEMSKAPLSSIPLLGYTAVKRESSHTCAWVFTLVPNYSSIARKSFACSNDDDRKDWMRRIKAHLYTANNIGKNSLSSKLREMKLTEGLTPEEEEYLEIETPVLSPEDISSDKTGERDVNRDDPSSDSDSDDADDKPDGRSTKTIAAKASVSIMNRKAILPPTKQNSQEQKDAPVQSPGAPPRYSAIIRGEECQYENFATTQKGKEWDKEKACTIVDEDICRDREKCIQLLKVSSKMGTYLIRKSRTTDQRVLAVLAPYDVVREYRIDESDGLYHFQSAKSHKFISIDTLLAHYSAYEKLPNLDGFLGFGIHEIVEGDLYEPI